MLLPSVRADRAVGSVVTTLDAERARAAIGRSLHRTPVLSSDTLGRTFGGRAFLKAELLQKTGSFRRAACSRSSRRCGGKARGVISISAAMRPRASRGRAHRRTSMPARDVAKREPAEDRRDEVLRGGGRPRVAGAGRGLRAGAGARSVHRAHLRPPVRRPGRHRGPLDPRTGDRRGRARRGRPRGAGGRRWARGRHRAGAPGRRVVGVEPEGSAALHYALAAGKPARSSRTRSPTPLLRPCRRQSPTHLQEHGVESVLVTEDDVRAGFHFLYERAKLAAEPKGLSAGGPSLPGKSPRSGENGWEGRYLRRQRGPRNGLWYLARESRPLAASPQP